MPKKAEIEKIKMRKDTGQGRYTTNARGTKIHMELHQDGINPPRPNYTDIDICGSQAYQNGNGNSIRKITGKSYNPYHANVKPKYQVNSKIQSAEAQECVVDKIISHVKTPEGLRLQVRWYG